MGEIKKGSVNSGEIEKKTSTGKSSVSAGFWNYEVKTDAGSAKVKSEEKSAGQDTSVEMELNKVSGEISAAEINLKQEDDILFIHQESEIDGKVLDAEGDVSNTVDLKNGNVDLGISGKGSVVSGEMKDTIGTEENNLHLNTEGSLVTGEVKAGISAGKDVTFYDAKGNKITGNGFGASVGAEGYLAEGSVTGGFTIFGITFDTTITGKLGGAGVTGTAGVVNKSVAVGFGIGAGAGFGVSIGINWDKFHWPWESAGETGESSGESGGGNGGGGSNAWGDTTGYTGGGGDDIHLRVTPEELKNQASNIQDQINRMNTEWNSLMRILSGMQNYWSGEAGESHGEQYKAFEDEMNRLLLKLKNHPDNLLKMAGLYEKTEAGAVSQAGALAGDIIV